MLKFYHAPWSRSSTIFWLLEELGLEYEMELVDIRGEGGAPEEYRKIQPNKKVPAIVHDGKVVTERAAITIYLGDVFPEKGLAPAIGDPDRAAYISTLVYHDAVFDPVVCAKVKGLSYVSNDYPFGLYEDMVAYLGAQAFGESLGSGRALHAVGRRIRPRCGYPAGRRARVDAAAGRRDAACAEAELSDRWQLYAAAR